ncbi:MAG: citramalate synthase [Candidatus Omnitrophica bacterium CG11_big_fil_rev_8_21_14_0_20_45_26]|uniref:Citramalate synthase n=1 Tax=Candidatus Abzuiibacterium crystallinum TaxID=1974748 RepID=A0A2H0LPJ4_9BACT|nr:MAG: citramalate synthase [Candidatus Omnitrophica bacterium CG11_big_fil_rev_8_21_14_0_20_45_26]PIW63547.1 MAG: citramalate synthase [Candidatus Omnitrophica bacterium CG12_big_fil_rev_8_21_14_0_65_45_16]
MKKIQIYDTTLRDGTQGEGVSLSLNDKLMLAKHLDGFGVDFIEGGWPGSNPKDMGFFKEAKKIKFKHAKIAAFGSTRRANMKVTQDDQVKLLLEAGTKVVTIFGKSWDFHVKEVFKTSLKENLNMIHDTVSFLKSKKKFVIYDAEHFFDGFFENQEYALKTIRAAAKAGADLICLCDTNGGMLPHQIAIAVKRIRKTVRTPIGIHCHNDAAMGVPNSVAAVEHGAIQVQGTINGYGERCGNANLTSIIPILQLKLNLPVVSDRKLKQLSELSHYVAEVCNMPVRSNQPFTGQSAFAHKGGVHVNAMMKNRKTYEHINPVLVGNHTRFLVSELSGKSNVLLKAQELKIGLSKDRAETKAILQKIQELENEGYQFEAAEASFELLIKKETGRYKKYFEVLEVRVLDEKKAEKAPVSEATVKVKVGSDIEHTTANGDGPVNALDKALRKALKRFYPVVEKIHLSDYKVRVVNSQAGTAAKVRVFIQFQDEKDTWSTVGVSENVIEASWNALVEAIEYKLMKN